MRKKQPNNPKWVAERVDEILRADWRQRLKNKQKYEQTRKARK